MMTGYQPKNEKTCGTCRHVGRSPLKDVCLDCVAEASKDDEHPEWQPKTGTPPTGGSSVSSHDDEIARLKRREAELLEANNRYLARARSAEEYVKTLRKVVCHLADAVGADALIAVVDDNTKLRAKLAAISARPRRRRWHPYV